MLTWLDLKNIMLSKRSQTRNVTLCDSMYMKHLESLKVA